ncbi:DUF6382 domain-containing protein [Cohnella fermenti]|uniref:FHA domain-containing protein n=1 Tax=Cohnella fermenti TaxID=2565925 RepID=A0A4S4BK42_9BACL|nr:DUF6382 domain-containing protein [Cohnella fermenti]THF74814.1 FHA domain-containing protein [Cohnella fermenti]
MIGYRVRFEQGRGHQMVLEGEPPLRAEEVDRLQVRMLASIGNVPGLLPLQAEEVDGTVALRYSLQGRRMLSQSLRVSRWTMDEVLEALAQLAEILEQANDYMLDLERFVLEDEFIFCGDGWERLAFVYVPSARPLPAVDIGVRMERLIVRWMINVETPDGPTLQKLLRQVGGVDFSPTQLRRLIRQLLSEPEEEERTLGEAHRRAARPEARGGTLAGQGAAEDGFGSRSAAEPAGRSRWGIDAPISSEAGRAHVPVPDEELGLSGLLGPERTGWEPKGNHSGAEPNDAGRWRIGLLAGAAAVSALVWRFVYLPQPGRRTLVLSAGATLLAIGACLYLWSGRGRTRSGKPERTVADRDGGGLSGGGDHGDGEDHEDPDNPEDDSGDRQDGMKRGIESAGGGSGLTAEKSKPEAEALTLTARLPSEQSTMLLSETDEQSGREANCYLEWECDDAKRKIRLAGANLVIGRSGEAAQHVDETPGVSRAHLELIRAEEGWQAKDLGSRNGSWLNGVPMAPYEAYPLIRGDSLQIASSLYRFQEERKLPLRG